MVICTRMPALPKTASGLMPLLLWCLLWPPSRCHNNSHCAGFSTNTTAHSPAACADHIAVLDVHFVDSWAGAPAPAPHTASRGMVAKAQGCVLRRATPHVGPQRAR